MILDSTRGRGKSAVHVVRRPHGGAIIDQAGHRVFVNNEELRELAFALLNVLNESSAISFGDGGAAEWVESQRNMWFTQTGDAKTWGPKPVSGSPSA